MICKKCGNEIKDGEKFCGKCGTKNDGQNTDKNAITITFSHLILILIIVVIAFIFISFIIYNNNNKRKSNIADTPSALDIQKDSSIQTPISNTNSSAKVDVNDESTYITDNPIPLQKELSPYTITSDEYMNTYDTQDIMAVVTASNYAMQNINIQKISYMMITHKDNYGRYRVMIKYFTPTSNTSNLCVVYYYHSKSSNKYKTFFEGHNVIANTGECNTPLDF